ncbi:MAG: YgjV family protein [Clostridiales bacterium]|nr:YgjV family protein [Clostridiales bacterium]
MNTQTIIAQGVGAVGMILGVLAFQCKDTKKLFLVQFLASLVCALQFLLLGAYTGLLLNIAGAIRLVVLYFDKKKWANHPATMWAVTLMMVLCGIFTWDGWLSLLPTAAQTLSTPLYFKKSGKLLRWGQLLFMSPCWLIYNLCSLAIPGVILEILNISSIIISLIRFKGKLT